MKDKFAELEGKVISENGLRVIRVLDKQLSEDKQLFSFLMDNGLVSEEGEELIRELIIKHTAGFDLWEQHLL